MGYTSTETDTSQPGSDLNSTHLKPLISKDSLSSLQTFQVVGYVVVSEVKLNVNLDILAYFYFNCVRNHIGDEGNKEVDGLAKLPSQNLDKLFVSFLPYPNSHPKRKVKINSMKLQQDRWKVHISISLTGSYTIFYFR